MAVPLTLPSVPAQTPYVQYISTSNQTVFPYPFEITQDSDLVCLINGVQQPTDGGYTLTGQGATGGGNLTFTLGQTAGAIITLFRNIPISRVTQLSQNGTFFSANFNNEYNRLYLIAQQLQQSIGQCLQIPNTNVGVTNPSQVNLLPANWANKYMSFDSNGNPTPTALTSSGAITLAILSGITGPQTAAEAAAGVTPTNLQYPCGAVDRYFTNTTPGTTDATAAFNTAAKVCAYGTGQYNLMYGYTGVYLVTDGINCTFGGTTNQVGYQIINVGGVPGDGASGAAPVYGIFAQHTKTAVFDCTGNDAIKFYNPVIHTSSSTFPKVAILFARNSNKGSLFNAIYGGQIAGYFSVSTIYNYGSEDDFIQNAYLANFCTSAGTKVLTVTAHNISSLTTEFTTDPLGNALTLASGSCSCTDHNYMNNQYYNEGGTLTSDCIYLDLAVDTKIIGGWAASGNVRAAAGAACTNATISGGTTLTLNSGVTGIFAIGQQIMGPLIPPGTAIASGTGPWTLNQSIPNQVGISITAGAGPGRACLYIDHTNGPSDWLYVHAWTCETIGVGYTQPFAILYGNETMLTYSYSGNIGGSKLQASSAAIAATGVAGTSQVTISGMHIDQPNSNVGVWFPGTVTFSEITTGYVLTIGTATRNKITLMGPSALVITTSSHNVIMADAATATWTAGAGDVFIDQQGGGINLAVITHQSGGTLGFYGKSPAAQTASNANMVTSNVVTSASFGTLQVAQIQQIQNVLYACGLYATH